MHVFRRIAVMLGLLALGVTGPLTSAHGVFAKSDVVGYVYVNDNTTPANTIGIFARHADGSLTALSPFTTLGTGKAIASQGSLQESSDGKFLLATDGGSKQISVLRIGSDGSLSEVSGSPFSSNGVGPNSIAVHGNLVYVSNYGDGTAANLPNYTGFTLSSSGQLTPISSSTYTLTLNANPGDILFNSTGKNLVATEIGTTAGTSFVDSFTVGSDGKITFASHFPGQGTGAFGSEFRPTDPHQLYVSNAHNGPNLATVSALEVATNGTVTSIGASPYPDKQTAACWVEITHDGRYLFTVNTAVSSISRYSIDHDGTLTLLGSTALANPSALGPVDARLDPTGTNLYVVDNGAATVSALQVHNGHLHELDSSPTALPSGAKPFGIVVTRIGGDGN
jgi:6-phosphogluconolactonase (cycloisomerase 2 family)